MISYGPAGAIVELGPSRLCGTNQQSHPRKGHCLPEHHNKTEWGQSSCMGSNSKDFGYWLWCRGSRGGTEAGMLCYHITMYVFIQIVGKLD